MSRRKPPSLAIRPSPSKTGIDVHRMCGIAALIRPTGLPVTEALAAMIRAVDHRGPDGQSLQAFSFRVDAGLLQPSPEGLAGLAHARLAILDLSNDAAQPMEDANQRLWITFNGEIYNHVELRVELELRGHSFRSRSDTEVLVACWAEWGAGCLDRLNGIFAFAILDTWEGRLWAVRDRFGVKPLYWWIGPDGTFALASEIKQFTTLPGWRARLHGQRTYDFLAWNLIDHTEFTMFQDVRQLRGGELLRLDVRLGTRGGPPIIDRWYGLQPDENAGALAASAAADRFLSIFRDAVGIELQADVDVGSCLSGGLDSSSLICIAAALRGQATGAAGQHTFSARSDVAAYDEGRYIAAAIEGKRIIAHEVFPALGGLFKLLPQLIWHQDEPFGTTSAYAQWHVFALARAAGIKVVLDGQGADEVLGGYHGFFGPRLADLLRRGRWLSLVAEFNALGQLHGIPTAQSFARMSDALLPDTVRQTLRRWIGKPSANVSWLNSARLDATTQDPFETQGARQPTVRALSTAQILSTNLPMLLHCEDRNSMAHGVEARVPFLDHRLVEFALGLSDEHKVSGGITKRVLRDAMRGIVPAAILERRDKLGFVTPEEQWVRACPALFRRHLVDAVEQSRGILRPTLVQDFEAMLNGRRRFDFRWWRAICFGAWMERFSIES